MLSTKISDKVFLSVAGMASWIFGLSGADALGPALIALFVVGDEALSNAETQSDSMLLAMSMCYQLFMILAAYWSGGIMRAFS
jgi:hypothetical protein